MYAEFIDFERKVGKAGSKILTIYSLALITLTTRKLLATNYLNVEWDIFSSTVWLLSQFSTLKASRKTKWNS